MPRPERLLNPDDGPVQLFAEQLRQLRRSAGNPGYRALGAQTGYSPTTLANAAGGRQLPTLAVTLAFVRGCGGDPLQWQRRWQQVAAEQAAARPSGAYPSDGGRAEQPPYRGLTGYGVEDADWFFGRDRLVAQLVEMLGRQPFVALFGASGSGKSSLLRAGLIPAMSGAGLQNPGGISPVPILMTPGAAPVAELRRALAPTSATQELLLVVDQFEELFTLCHDGDERIRFVAELADVIEQRDRRTRVVIGVRADFYGRCAEVPTLAELLAGAAVPVGPLDEEQLRQVVTEPARRAGLSVERALLTKILADAAGQPGALPLVSHALLQTWRYRRGEVLAVAEYEAAGGLAGAIAQSAETVYQRLTAAEQQTTRRVLTRLVTLGEGVDDTRRRAARAELDFPEAETVLQALAAARLIVLDEDMVDVAHEALIGAWPRLYDWLHADRQTIRLHRQLTDDSRIWDRLGRDPGALYRGARLSAWEGRGTDALNQLERTFLAASHERAERAVRSRRRRIRLAVAGLAGGMAITSVSAGLAFVQADRAADQRDLAVSRQLMAEARGQAQLDPRWALALARRAYDMHPDADAEMVLRQAVADDRTRAVTAGRQGHATGVAYSPDGTRMASTGTDDTLRVWRRTGTVGPDGDVTVLSGYEDDAWSPVFSPDGRWVAAAGRDGTIRMWPADGAGPATVFRGHAGGASGIAFSPDSRRLASAGDDATVRIWPVEDPAAPVVLRGHVGRVWGVAFSPDGRRVASSGYVDRTVRIWDVTGAVEPIVLRGHGDYVTMVRFSPDGTRVASASGDGTARVWPANDQGSPVVLRGHQGTVNGLAFSPDGKWLATTGDDSTVRVWNPAGAEPAAHRDPLVLRGHKGNVWDTAFSPDGSELASAGEDGTVRTWSPWGNDPVLLHGHQGGAWTAAFTADGRRVVSGGEDGTIRVRGTDGRGDALVLRGHEQEVLGLTTSADGQRVASAGRDGTVRIWDLSRPKDPLVLRGHKKAVWTAAISPDGHRVASASFDGTLRIWDIAHGSPPLVRRADPNQIRYVAFSPDGQRVATAGADGTVRVWDVTGTARPLILRGHEGLVWAVAFSPDRRRVASAGSDGTVRIWPLTPAGAPLVLTGHEGFAWHLAFSHDGRWVASAGYDDTVRIWRSTQAGSPITYSGFVASVENVAFGPDSYNVVTAHGDGTVRVWRCEACQPTEQLLAHRASGIEPTSRPG